MKLIIFMCSWFLVNSAMAQTVAVIDMEKVIQSTKEGQQARKRIKQEFDKNKSQFEKREKQLEKEAKKYESQKSLYSADQQMEKEKDLGERMQGFESDLQEQEQKIQQLSERLTQPILDKIQMKVAELSKTQGYTVVLEKKSAQVFWVKDSADITNQVMKLLK